MSKKRMFKYLVYYTYNSRRGLGTGRMTVTRSKKIESLEDVYELDKFVEKVNSSFIEATIIDWKLMK